jgi:2C-methyl-D-erythritol 2,4-cyclodiphosphate synthase
MRKFAWMLVAALGALLAVTGCGHKGRVSTSELQSSFKEAEPAMQTLVDKAVSAVKSNNYPEALGDLQVLSHKARLTPDQQQALKDTIAEIQQKVSSTTNTTAQPAERPSMPEYLQKLLGKQK